MCDKNGNKKLRKPSSKLTGILAENIKTFRKKNLLSQEELADLCKIHRTFIGSVEREERNVTLSTLEIIAEVLGVNVPLLLTKGGIKK